MEEVETTLLGLPAEMWASITKGFTWSDIACLRGVSHLFSDHFRQAAWDILHKDSFLDGLDNKFGVGLGEQIKLFRQNPDIETAENIMAQLFHGKRVMANNIFANPGEFESSFKKTLLCFRRYHTLLKAEKTNLIEVEKESDWKNKKDSYTRRFFVSTFGLMFFIHLFVTNNHSVGLRMFGLAMLALTLAPLPFLPGSRLKVPNFCKRLNFFEKPDAQSPLEDFLKKALAPIPKKLKQE
jgi:hypothetical protein